MLLSTLHSIFYPRSKVHVARPCPRYENLDKSANYMNPSPFSRAAPEVL